MKIIQGCLLTLMIVGSAAHADTVTHRQAAEQMLLLTRADQMIDNILQQMETIQLQQLEQMNLPPQSQPLLQKYVQKMNTVLKRELNWEMLKSEYIDLYTQSFTEAELKQLVLFYQSPLGQKYIEQTPHLMKASMQIGHERAMRVMPELQAISDEMSRELKQEYGQP